MNTPLHRITLYKANGSWIMRTTDKRVFDLFGTYDLPTAFTDKAQADVVIRTIQGLNPESIVTIEDYQA